MLKYIRKLLMYITHPLKVKYLLCLMNDGYLYDRGWLQSFLTGTVCDKNGKPIPWLTYAALDFLKTHLLPSACIFEYGSGYSTLYFSLHYASVTSVENDKLWYDKIANSVAGNCTLFFEEDQSAYINAIEKLNQKFDLILVDGAWRNECLLKAVEYLSEKGIIIMDDAERTAYQEAIQQLKETFFSVPFTSMKALSYETHTTLIFFKLPQ